jgi:CPA2 family monovalent cation:H+ antiporter-2
VLVVTISDLMAARSAIVRARHLNPELTIITRAVSRNEVHILKEAGADEIIQPEFEAGLECADHMLRTLGMPDAAVRSIVNSHRFALYDDVDALLEAT